MISRWTCDNTVANSPRIPYLLLELRVGKTVRVALESMEERAMRLNDAQVNHFKVFGFVVLRQFFSQDELGGP